MRKYGLAALAMLFAGCGGSGGGTSTTTQEFVGVLATIEMPQAGPFGARVTPDGSKLFVPLFGNYGAEGPGSTVVVLDVETHAILAELPVGQRPEDVDFAGDYAYITCSDSASVSVIHVPTLSVVTSIAIGLPIQPGWEGTYPYGLAIQGGKGYVFCSAYADGNDEHIKIIDVDPASPTFHQKIGGITLSGVYTRGGFRGGELVVVRGQAGNDWAANPQIAFFDTATDAFLTSISIAQAPGGFHGMEDIAITPNGKYAYAASFNSGSGEAEVYVIDLVNRRFQDLILLDNGDITTHGVACRPDGLLVAVTSWNAGTVSFVFTPTNTVVYEFASGVNPNDVAFTPDGRKAYVTNQNGNSLTALALPSTNALLITLVEDAIANGRASEAATADLQPRVNALRGDSNADIEEIADRIHYWASRDEIRIGKDKNRQAPGADRNDFVIPAEGIIAK